MRPPAQGLLDGANHRGVGGAGATGGKDERRLGACGRLDGNNTPRQDFRTGGGKVLPQVGAEVLLGSPRSDLAQELGGADATALAGRGRREMDCSSVVSSVGATLAVVPGD